jgi:hypothetical protein
MHLEKPSLAKYLGDPKLQGYAVLQKIFFAPTESSQRAGAAFIERLSQRKEDREPVSGPTVAQAQMAAFRDWEKFAGKRWRTNLWHTIAISDAKVAPTYSSASASRKCSSLSAQGIIFIKRAAAAI